jgi:predicted nucleotidyltransferase
MAMKHQQSLPTAPERIYWGADVPMRVIRRFARGVAERFGPDRIILFGSHAYGAPHEDSDVDILVVMPARNRHSQAERIRWEVPAQFPMDLLVRTPEKMARRLKEGLLFLRRSSRMAWSCTKTATRAWVRKAEADFRGARSLARNKAPRA